MADRDLLNKPLQLPTVDNKAVDKQSIVGPQQGPLGVQVRPREVAAEADAALTRGASQSAGASPAREKGPATYRGPPPVQRRDEAPAREPAFKAAYFNRDVEATGKVNQRTRELQALRGGEGATDLKKIVLPPLALETTADPERLSSATGRMADPQGRPPGLGALLERQGLWLSAKEMTAELILERLAYFERMVEARRAALARMKQKRSSGPLSSPTLSQGLAKQEARQDPEGDSQELIDETSEKAAGMHRRVARVLGVIRR